MIELITIASGTLPHTHSPTHPFLIILDTPCSAPDLVCTPNKKQRAALGALVSVVGRALWILFTVRRASGRGGVKLFLVNRSARCNLLTRASSSFDTSHPAPPSTLAVCLLCPPRNPACRPVPLLVSIYRHAPITPRSFVRHCRHPLPESFSSAHTETLLREFAVIMCGRVALPFLR